MDFISFVHKNIKQTYVYEKEEKIKSMGLISRTEYDLTSEELVIIHRITEQDKYLEIHENEFYEKHAKNGIIKIYDGEELVGFIFAHDSTIEEFKFYERGTLWIDPNLRNVGLGKYLMLKMTEHLRGKNILSVTSNSIVQKINELLMDYEVISPSGLIKDIIEIGGPLKESYRYYINMDLKKSCKE